MHDELTPERIIDLLELEPHPEGGWYRETWASPPGPHGRPTGTAIHFLLTSDRSSHWHRIDAAEVWHHYAGAPLELSTWTDGADQVRSQILGTDLAVGERPQSIVEPDEWQAARTLGDWTLVGCTVSPGFRFDRFEMAPSGWEPPSSSGV